MNGVMRGRVRFAAGLVTLLGCVVAATSLFAQVPANVRDRALKEARELARLGNREAAIEVLEAVYAEGSLDGGIVLTLASLLGEGGEIERAKAILIDYTGKRGGDNRALSTLAALHFQSGEKRRGMEVIERIVRQAPDKLWPYQVGMDAMIAAEMQEELLEFVERARRATGDSTVFAVDAAGIHRGAGRFGVATREYLRAGTAENMSPEIAAEYIVSLAKDEEARPVVVETLTEVGSIGLFARAVTRSLAEIHLMDQNCASALEKISDLVEMDPSSADVLVSFAQRASGTACFAECARAYEILLRHARKDHKAAEFLVAKARCEAAGGMPEEAMATFDRVAAEYRTYKVADEALMGRAVILRESGSIPEAIAEAERILESRYSDNVFKAVLFKADCQVLMGDLEAALNTYDEVGSDWPPEFAQEAFFNLGEISLYRGEFDDAQGYYNVTLRQYPDEARANDAIDRLLLVKSSGAGASYDPRLGEFAGALLMHRQGDTSGAAAVLGDLGNMEGEEPIRVESLRALAEIYVTGGLLDDAVRTYRLIGDSLETPASPLALEAVGDIYLSSGRTEDAIRAYEDVILKFPESVSAGEARRKIDMATRGPDSET